MTFISKYRVIKDGTGGVIQFRHPTVEEWNKYSELQIPTVMGGELAVREDSLAKRLEFFRTWCVAIEGYEDELGPIGIGFDERLPVDLRLTALWRAFDKGYPDIRREDFAKNSVGTSESG